MKDEDFELKKVDLLDENEMDEGEAEEGDDWGKWVFVICKVGVGDA